MEIISVSKINVEKLKMNLNGVLEDSKKTINLVAYIWWNV